MAARCSVGLHPRQRPRHANVPDMPGARPLAVKGAREIVLTLGVQHPCLVPRQCWTSATAPGLFLGCAATQEPMHAPCKWNGMS